MVRRKAMRRQDAPLEQMEYEQPRQQEALRYIAEMAGELASLAGAERMPMLTYFLNMARVEAEMAVASDLGDTRAKNPSRRRADA